MRFSSATVAAFLGLLTSSASAFTVRGPQSSSYVMTRTTRLYSSTVDEEAAAVETTSKRKSKKDDRLRMMKSPNFYRQGFKEVRTDVEKTMGEQFQGDIVESLKSNNFVMERDGVKVYLAKVRWNIGASKGSVISSPVHFMSTHSDFSCYCVPSLCHN
jgi:4-hydroxy-3-methylbut-2-enyl diphosphate reductase